jgi:hypothetical protein
MVVECMNGMQKVDQSVAGGQIGVEALVAQPRHKLMPLHLQVEVVEVAQNGMQLRSLQLIEISEKVFSQTFQVQTITTAAVVVAVFLHMLVVSTHLVGEPSTGLLNQHVAALAAEGTVQNNLPSPRKM